VSFRDAPGRRTLCVRGNHAGLNRRDLGVIPGCAASGAGPESIILAVAMDSGLVSREGALTPRNDSSRHRLRAFPDCALLQWSPA
jgi:hypothetical protein